MAQSEANAVAVGGEWQRVSQVVVECADLSKRRRSHDGSQPRVERACEHVATSNGAND